MDKSAARKPGGQIWLAALVMVALGAALSAWQIDNARRQHLLAAGRLVSSLANATAQRLAGTLRGIDQLLIDAARQVGDPAKVDTATLASLRTRITTVPELVGLSFTDGDGTMLARTDPTMPVGYKLTDRQHFQFQQTHFAENRLYIGPPVEDPIRRRPVIFLSRPILGADGGLVGTVSTAAPPDFVTDALAATLRPEGTSGVFFTDGRVMKRLPDDGYPNASMAETPVFKAYQRGEPFADVVGRMDATRRVVGFAPVPGYPLVVAVGLSRDSILAETATEMKIQIALQMGFTAIVLSLAWGFQRSERRRQSVTARLIEMDHRHLEELSTAVAERTRELDEAMAALKDSETRFRSIVDTAPLPIVLTRIADDRVAYINEAAAQAFGVPRASAEGLKAPEHYDDPAVRIRLKAALEQAGTVRDFEATLRRANGERFDALLSVGTFTIEGERMMITVAHDVTESRRLHQELARSNSDLEQFSYAVSHDLQEPLRMVSSYLALLERRSADHLTDEAREFIFFAVDGAQRMSRMISDLLEYSRVHRRGRRFAPVELDVACSEALANLAAAIGAAEAEIVREPLPRVVGDASQLMRVFQNLVSNALKYRRPDAKPVVRIAAHRDGAEWRVSVADNGIGIDPGQADRLFQVFQRLHSRVQYEGSGIGLALCRRIVERHGGRIWFESAGTDQGSTFHFTLPAESAGGGDVQPMPMAAL